MKGSEALFLFEEQKDNKLTFVISARRVGDTDSVSELETGSDPTISVDEKITRFECFLHFPLVFGSVKQ